MGVSEEVLARSQKDAGLLLEFVAVWCRGQHQARARRPYAPGRVIGQVLPAELPDLCDECARELGYAIGRRFLCPHPVKPACKHCPEPCYAVDHRDFMRAVMRYSGMRLLLRGRFELLWKYFF